MVSDTSALVGISCFRSRSFRWKDMSLVGTAEMLYNAKARRTDSEQVLHSQLHMQ